MNNIGKRILSLLCVIVMMLPMIPMAELPLKAEAATEGLDLSAMQIVVPQNATAVENTAATELQNYLYQITGTRPAIKIEGQQSGGSIFIGATTRAKNLKVTYPTAGDVNGEAWAIQVKGSHLILVGAPTRGPLYAVYHLLEDVLGVRWWNPWEEDVPKGKAIVPADYSASGVPAMEYREVFMGLETGLNEKFNVRNRMNGNHTSISAAYGGEETYGWPAHVHTFNRYFDASDFSAHPEWFALIDGSRNADSQLCLTNTGLIAEYAARLVSHVPDDPDGIYSISPNDNVNFCQCTSCKNEINTYGTSGYVLRFVNKMADAVTAAGYTKAKVEMLVYWAYIDLPTGGVTPASNVLIRFADNYVDILHSLDHANNADTVSKLQGWANICSNDLYYWQYVVVYQNNGVLPSMFNYGSDITKMQAMGVNGWFAEQEQCINADFWDMKLWLITKLMENPVSGAEYTALMDEFIYGYYGEAAGKHIRDYLYLMHAKAEASNADVTFSTNIIGAEWLTVQDIIQGYDYFEKAVAAAGSDATLQRRIRAARSGFDRVIHENFATWKTQAASAGLTLPFTQREVGKRIYQTMTEQIALRGIYDPDYPKFYNYYNNNYGENQHALPSEFDGAAREHILDYTFEEFRTAGAGSIVADSESLVGQAYYMDTSSMSTLNSTQRAMMKAITINAYDPAGTTNNDLRTIGSISAKNLTRNSGYKLYSIDWTVPQMGNDPTDYVYIFDDWGLQIPDMKRDLNLLAGQTVRIYLSVKANGSLSSSTYFKGQYYIDRVIVLPTPNQLTHNYVSAPSAYSDGCRVVCNTCGDVITGEHTWNDGEVTAEPTYEAEGVKTFTCTACGKTKTEAIAKLEKPVSPIDSIPSGHLIADRDYTSFPEKTEQNTAYVADADAYNGMAVRHMDNNINISITRYDSSVEQKIGTLSPDDLKVGQGYQLHKFTFDVPANATTGSFLYIMSNWQFQSNQLCEDFVDYAGKTVEVYISMKVEGPVDGMYYLYIDRVVLASVCDDYIGEDGLCSRCGKAMSLTFLAEDFELAYYKAGICDCVVEDAASAYGTAARFSYTERFATGDGGLYNDMICSAQGEKRMYTRADGVSDVQVGQFTGAQLQANAAGGQYVTYVFRKLNLTDVNFVYMFSESLRTRFTAAQKNFLKDRPVDMAVSLRVEGDVTGANTANPPVYYIDCITFTPSELDEIDRIPNGHLASMRDSSYFSADANEGTTYVTDEEAYGGKAVCFTRAKLTTDPKISINRYDVASGLGDGAQELKIGSLDINQLNINQGYQIYKFTYDVPVQTTEGNTFYIMSNWQLNSSQFAKDFAPYAGKTVEVYISMKVEGPAADGNYSVSVDRVALATVCEDYPSENGVLCSVCGKFLNADGEYKMLITNPEGTVYPYQDCVKNYWLDESINIRAYYVAGTKEAGDSSIAPVVISWSDSDDSEVTKYVVEYATREDYSDAITVEKSTGLDRKEIEVYNLYKASTYYVRVTAYADQTVLGQAESTFQTTDLGPRIMNIGGLYNVRDLGGYVTEDGKTTLQGLIFRGCEMDNEFNVTQEGKTYMSEVLGIRTDLDFRGNVDASPIPSAQKIAVGISAYLDAFAQKDLYRQIFSTLANEDNYPVYMHCVGGADRTGTVAYLINALLGVPEEILIRDYEMTSYSVFGERTKDFYAYKYPEFVAQLKTYEGDTLAEKTENYMLSIGVTADEIYNIRAIMLGEPTKTVVQPQDIFHATDSEFTVTFTGNKTVASVVIDGKAVAFTAAEKGFTVAAEAMPETMKKGTVYGTVTFTDGMTAAFQFEYDDTNPAKDLEKAEAAGHVFKNYVYSDFGTAADQGTNYVDDTEAYGGKAVCNDNANLTGNRRITITRYDAGTTQYVEIGNISATDVKFDQGYQFYKFTFQLPAEGMTETNGTRVYFLNDWQLNSKQMGLDMKNLAGKTVDMYLSMKVTGTSTNAQVYIDRVALVTHCEDHVSDDGFFCTVCGKMLVPTPVLSWNLVLDGNIGMKFNLNVAAEEAANATVGVTVNGETTTKNVADLLVDGKYVLLVELAAAQMADNVTVTLNKGGETLTKDYSVRGYADKILNGDYTEETKNLVKYMLAYGAASQTYFKYNDAEENLADKGIEVTPATVSAEGGVYSVTGSAKGVKYYGSSLVYRNKIAVRIYFSGDVTGKTFTVNGETVTPETNGDLHYIEVANIYPQDLADGITVAVDGLTVTYAPMDYIIRMYAKGSNVAALVQALYGYYLAADAYIA